MARSLPHNGAGLFDRNQRTADVGAISLRWRHVARISRGDDRRNSEKSWLGR